MESSKSTRNRGRDINMTREWVKLFLGIVLAAFGMGIIAYSLIVAPVGVIHASVVTTFGTILTWVGAMFGIDSNAKIRLHEQDIDFELRSRELDEKMKRLDARFGRVMEKDDDREEY